VFLLGFVGIGSVPVPRVIVHSIRHTKGVVEAKIVGFDLPLLRIGFENRLTKPVDDVICLRAGIAPLLFLFLPCVGQRLGDRLLGDFLIRDRVIDLTGY